jgi:threonine/homoserine/homoserine lactone efflux protein
MEVVPYLVLVGEVVQTFLRMLVMVGRGVVLQWEVVVSVQLAREQIRGVLAHLENLVAVMVEVLGVLMLALAVQAVYQEEVEEEVLPVVLAHQAVLVVLAVRVK